MATLGARYTREEFAKRGQTIFDREIAGAVRPEDDGKFVAIDIDSEDFELDKDDYAATERLLVRHPDAQIWLIRIGDEAAYRIG